MSKKKKRKPDIWPGMTAKQHEALTRYIRSTADAIGLREWRIRLVDEPCEDQDSLAEVNTTYGRLHASIRVCKDWFDWPLEERRHAIMHELVHVHTDRVEQPIRDELTGHVSFPVSQLLLNSMHTNMEYAVDEIARILVKFSDDQDIVHYLEGRMKP